MRLLLAAISLFVGFQCKADLNYDQLQQSVYKVYKMDVTGRPMMVASAFAVNYKSATYVITNNHVCFGVSGPGRSYIKIVNGSSNNIARDYDEIVQVAPMPGSDVCVIKTRNNHPGLTLSPTSAKIHQTVTVFGYIGRSDFSMPTTGYMYGYDKVIDWGGFRNCKDYPPKTFRNELLCVFYDQYPMMVESLVSMSNVNVGPGYSGSPVFNSSGEVVGIIARYIPPSDIYGNGDGIFYDLRFITRAIDTARFVPVDSQMMYDGSKLIEYENDMLYWREELEDLK